MAATVPGAARGHKSRRATRHTGVGTVCRVASGVRAGGGHQGGRGLPGGVGRLGPAVEDTGGQATVEQQAQRQGQGRRVRGPGLLGQALHPRPHLRLVPDGAVVDGGAGLGLRRGVDERTAVEPVAPAGRGEGVEHPDELVPRVGAGRLGRRLERAAPAGVDPVEVGEHEVVLAREVLVERRLGDRRLGDDRVDPDGADAAGVEQPEGRVEDAVAGGTHGRQPRTTLMLKLPLPSEPMRDSHSGRYISAPRAEAMPPRSWMCSGAQPKPWSSTVTLVLASASSPATNTSWSPPPTRAGSTMTSQFMVLRLLTTFAPGKARWTCSPRLSVLTTESEGGKPLLKSSGLAMSSSTLPSRLSAPAWARASRVATPEVALTTSSAEAAASANVAAVRWPGPAAQSVALGLAASREPMVTSWPSSASLVATAWPTMPVPRTAIFMSVSFAAVGRAMVPGGTSRQTCLFACQGQVAFRRTLLALDAREC